MTICECWLVRQAAPNPSEAHSAKDMLEDLTPAERAEFERIKKQAMETRTDMFDQEVHFLPEEMCHPNVGNEEATMICGASYLDPLRESSGQTRIRKWERVCGMKWSSTQGPVSCLMCVGLREKYKDHKDRGLSLYSCTSDCCKEIAAAGGFRKMIKEANEALQIIRKERALYNEMVKAVDKLPTGAPRR